MIKIETGTDQHAEVKSLVTTLLGDEPITAEQRRYLRWVLLTLGAAVTVIERTDDQPEAYYVGLLESALEAYQQPIGGAR